jgi:hypothetical protein
MIEPHATPSKPRPTNGAIQSIEPNDVRVAAQLSYEMLGPTSGADWTRAAGALTWDCRHTLNHVVGALDKYSRWLANPTGMPTPRDRLGDPDLTVADLLAMMQLRAGVLAVVAAAAAPTARGYHPWGLSDSSGYVAMGCAEILLHTYDISRGLGADYQPPEGLSQRVVARLFPWAPAAADPWSALRWATGRLDLPGQERTPPDWAWHTAPVAEWDGTTRPVDTRPYR